MVRPFLESAKFGNYSEIEDFLFEEDFARKYEAFNFVAGVKLIF